MKKLCILFVVLRWLSIEIPTEIGFFERDFIFRFALFRESVGAIVAEYIVWTIIEYGGMLLLCPAILSYFSESISRGVDRTPTTFLPFLLAFVIGTDYHKMRKGAD